ncbi:hypothetical protein [Pseudomonas chlororaphis]|uniref:hypothetical protein n=1 Tax=Pseudomonas chlororaphis TaxID=587753 RepID=UPI000F580206|nr:hypothetical protein [Pseudomonas chlororaphis]AZD79158.1 hypothetical protein C4K15_2591 [Pseudomonas chlororaphis subsp. aurantiaca]
MTRRTCLAIGVSTLTPLPNQTLRFAYLDGAVLAARSIGDWALRSGFGADNVRIVDDGPIDGQGNPVTRERVQQAVDELFPAGAEVVEQLILAFCGHGLTDANIGSISWLFSDSLRQKYRVLADSFYTELLLHGVQRITLITDACREAPKNLDLTRLDAVRGIVVQGTQVENPKFDRLAACQDGQLGYMVSEPMSGAPGKCVFSGVIADALWGIEPTAISNGLITTATLGMCVRSRTTERAKEYRLKLNPQCLVDPEPAVLYNTAQPLPGPAGLQPWPAAGNAATMGPSPAAGPVDSAEHNLERVHSDAAFRQRMLGADFGLKQHDLAVPADQMISIPDSSKELLQDLVVLRQQSPRFPEKKQKVKALVQRLEADAAAEMRQSAATEVRRRMKQIGDPGEANLIVYGEGTKLLSRNPIERLDSSSLFETFHAPSDPQGMPVLVALADGTSTPVVPYAGQYAVVMPSPLGDIFQAYGMPKAPDRYLAMLGAIDDFAAGRLQAEDIDQFAAGVCHKKHADPMLGVICAYLYRAVADYDSIRRLAYFYAAQGQPVPFDIALLGAMRVTREPDGTPQLQIPAVKARALRPKAAKAPDYIRCATPAVQAWIGGRCPWLGLGWDYVNDPRPEWAALVEGLAEHAKAVRHSGSTVLPGKVARKLAKAWRLRPAAREDLTRPAVARQASAKETNRPARRSEQ